MSNARPLAAAMSELYQSLISLRGHATDVCGRSRTSNDDTATTPLLDLVALAADGALDPPDLCRPPDYRAPVLTG